MKYTKFETTKEQMDIFKELANISKGYSSLAEFSKLTYTRLIDFFNAGEMDIEAAACNLTNTMCAVELGTKHGIHFFLEPGVAEFLETVDIKFDVNLDFSFLPRYNFFIHFPKVNNCKINRRKSLWVSNGGPAIFPNGNGGIVVTGKAGMLQCFDGEFIQRMQTKKTHDFIAERFGEDLEKASRGSGVAGENTKIAAAFLLYAEAFPDSVIKYKGDSDINCKGTFFRTKMSHEASSHKKDHDRNSASPHWRRGHFRMLSSDMFKNKKGQTVFVKGTFVKGHAFSVMNDAPPCQ